MTMSAAADVLTPELRLALHQELHARPPQARLPVEHAPTAPAPLELERAPEARTAPEHLPDRRIDGSAPRPEMPALAPPPQAHDNERPREVRPALIRPEPEPAARPANSRLSKASLDRAGFARLPDWRDALARYLAELSEKG